MCGIFGAVGAPSWVERIDLGVAVRALHHRGPDGNGTFRDRAESPDGRGQACALAHTRLSIVDLSDAGRQPMTTTDGRFTIAFNGEVYNFPQVRAELEALGESFRSNCDTEVVLRAFARWGPDVLGRLRGMFAFAIWDARARALFLARDRLGVKPLYYCRTEGGWAFASEVRALLATGTAGRKISPAGLAGFLQTGSVVDPDTLVEGVRALPAGFSAFVTDSGFEPSRYWTALGRTPGKMTYDQAVEELTPILREAIRLRLVSDVPLGVFLSGGIDSSAVAAVAASQSSERLRTFTVTFDETAYDEAAFASDVARKAGTDHSVVHLSAARALAEIGPAFSAQDQPSGDGPNTYVISKGVREVGLKVALSGVGGDEVFAGYGSFRIFERALAMGRLGRVLPAAFGAWLSGLMSSPRVPNRLRKALQLATSRGDHRDTYAVLRQMFAPAQCRRLLSRDFENAIRGSIADDAARSGPADGTSPTDAVNELSILELTGYLRNTLLRDMDGMSMAHALEVREPLLDHLVVEKALQVEGRLKLDNVRKKPLLVDSAPGLAQMIADRPKMGFTLPFETWFRGELRPWCESILLGPEVHRLRFLRAPEVRATWLAFQGSRSAVSFGRVATLLSLVRWSLQHGIED